MGEQISYLWQAGILLVFNEGDMPKYDKGDSAFMKRMVVAPMRSQFFAKLDPEAGTDPLVFQVDPRPRRRARGVHGEPGHGHGVRERHCGG